MVKKVKTVTDKIQSTKVKKAVTIQDNAKRTLPKKEKRPYVKTENYMKYLKQAWLLREIKIVFNN